MTTSESDSEVDFESADEGEIESNQHKLSQAAKSVETFSSNDKPKLLKLPTNMEETKDSKEEKSKEISKVVDPDPNSNISDEQHNENVNMDPLNKKSSISPSSTFAKSHNVAKLKSNVKCPNQIESKVPNEKPVASIEESKPNAKIEQDQTKMVTNIKVAKSIDESKSRAKSEEKPEKINTNVTRKLSNPEKTTRVLLHMEKKALEKSGCNKTSQNILTDNEMSVLERLGAPKEDKKTPSPGWGLGNWGTSFISSAANSVSTFTSHVTQGFETVLETVEASLGAPSPEELATNLAKKEENESDSKNIPQKQDISDSLPSKNHESHEGLLPGGILGGVSALTRALESTGSKVITGGLDTLELIGKKTMDILTEGDPGLRNKRNIFGGEKTTLSQVLREARDKLENASVNDQSYEDPFPIHYSKLFDDFQGLVHLEALEILSKQSKTKLQTIESESDEFLIAMEEIRTLCEDLPPTDDTPDEGIEQDFNNLFSLHVSSLPFKLNVDKIINIPNDAKKWLQDCKEKQDRRETVDAKEIYIEAITVLAKLSSSMMEVYHKIAELLLVNGPPLTELYVHSKHLTSLTSVLCLEIVILTSEFCRCLNTAADDSEDPDSVNPLITNVYLEASNSSLYIQDAFSLLIPVLQEIASTFVKV